MKLSSIRSAEKRAQLTARLRKKAWSLLESPAALKLPAQVWGYVIILAVVFVILFILMLRFIVSLVVS